MRTVTQQEFRGELLFIRVASLLISAVIPLIVILLVGGWISGIGWFLLGAALLSPIAFAISFRQNGQEVSRRLALTSVLAIGVGLTLNPDEYFPIRLVLFALPPPLIYLSRPRTGVLLNLGFLALLQLRLLLNVGGLEPINAPLETRQFYLIAYTALVVYVIAVAYLNQRQIVALQRQAVTDPATGLPNLTVFSEGLGHGPSQALLVEVANSSHLSARFGAETVQAARVALAARLQFELGSQWQLFQYREHAYMLLGSRDLRETLTVIRRSLEEPISSGPFRIPFEYRYAGCSVARGDEPRAIIRRLDTAMREAAYAPAGTYVESSPEQRDRAARRLLLTDLLPGAMGSGEFRLVYQPIVAAASGIIEGVEVLSRWESSDFGSISPGEFVPLIEDLGLMVPFTEQLLQRLGGDIAQVFAQTRLTVSVNLSPLHLEDRSALPRLLDVLARMDTNKARLMLELTEGVLMSDNPATTDALAALRERGSSLAIDDFGTGYSSLDYLRRYPVDRIKIDRRFVTSIHELPRNARIVSSIVELARGIGSTVVAEGVQEESERTVIRDLGVDAIQGYLFGRPVPAEELYRKLGLAVEAVSGASSASR